MKRVIKIIETIIICSAIGFIIGFGISIHNSMQEAAKDPKYKDPYYLIGILTNTYEVYEGKRDK